MKPHVAYDLPGTRDAIEKVFGGKIGRLFVPNPEVEVYAIVLRFPEAKVVVSGELDRALGKVGAIPGRTLVIARDMTFEARRCASTARCDVMTQAEFGWTDESYQSIRQR